MFWLSPSYSKYDLWDPSWSNSCLALQSHLMPISVLFILLQLMWIPSTLFYLKVCLLGILLLERSFPRLTSSLHACYLCSEIIPENLTWNIKSPPFQLYTLTTALFFLYHLNMPVRVCMCVCICEREGERGGGEGEKEKDIKVHTEMERQILNFVSPIRM